LARDLTALLNTRLAPIQQMLAPYPACRRSILSYGLPDFSALSLSSSTNRSAVCAALTEAIARHEPRLVRVRTALVPQRSGTNRLSFTIEATLARTADEAICFDGLFEPAKLQFQVRQSPQHSSGGHP
jgi:type VI secretion system protein ImpF